jgi:hypothetical protein
MNSHVTKKKINDATMLYMIVMSELSEEEESVIIYIFCAQNNKKIVVLGKTGTGDTSIRDTIFLIFSPGLGISGMPDGDFPGSCSIGNDGIDDETILHLDACRSRQGNSAWKIQ